MELVEVYRCLCDETRLRILNLLSGGPLCVCHFQEILAASQVKISKHLAYLRRRGLVEARREGAWIIYSLQAQPSAELAANMKCLQDCCGEKVVFKRDVQRMKRVLARCGAPLGSPCEPERTPRSRKPKLQRC